MERYIRLVVSSLGQEPLTKLEHLISEQGWNIVKKSIVPSPDVEEAFLPPLYVVTYRCGWDSLPLSRVIAGVPSELPPLRRQFNRILSGVSSLPAEKQPSIDTAWLVVDGISYSLFRMDPAATEAARLYAA